EILLEPPEPLGLREGERQARHFEELAAHAPDEIVEFHNEDFPYKKCSRKLSCSTHRVNKMIRYEIAEGIAVITIDNPPVNELGSGVLDEIEAAIGRGIDDPSVRALVLIGAGETFVAGVDINIFTTTTPREQSLALS